MSDLPAGSIAPVSRLGFYFVLFWYASMNIKEATVIKGVESPEQTTFQFWSFSFMNNHIMSS